MSKEHSTQKSRKKAVEKLRRGVPIAEVAAELQVDRTTVLRWYQRYQESGDAGLEQRAKSGRPRSKLLPPTADLRSIILKPALKGDRHSQLWTVSRLSDAVSKSKPNKRRSVRSDKTDKTDTLRRRLAEVGIEHPKPAKSVRDAYRAVLVRWNSIAKEIRAAVKKDKSRLFAIREAEVFVERLAGEPEDLKLSTRPTGKRDDREYVVALFAISDTRRLVFQFYAKRASTADIASFVERLYLLNKRRPLTVALPYAREHNNVIKSCSKDICPRLHLYEIPRLTKAKGSKKKEMKLESDVYVDCCFAKLFSRRSR